MSKEKRRVPKLRFPGFTEDWEQRKLTDIAKTFIGLVTTMTENYRDSGTLLIRNSDIKEGQFIFSEKPIHLDEEFAEKNKTRRLQIGDVVTVHTGDIGTSAVIQEKEAGAIGFATINTRTDKRILNPYFLSTYFNTEKHKCYANSVSTGDGRSNYNIKDFNKLVISIPTLDEQEKISVLINNINTIITLHQRKLDNLKLKKKALLQKLFPKNGERYPELRFPGFTDAWEQRKFGDLFEYERPDAYIVKSDNYNNDFNMPVLTANKAFILGYTNEENSYNKPSIIFDDFTLDRKYVDFPYMLKSSAIKILTSKNQHNLRFLFERLNSTRFEVLGHARHYISVVQNTTTLCPSVDEEVCISNLLTKFNELITLHQRKLDHLKLQKKALLQQMFV